MYYILLIFIWAQLLMGSILASEPSPKAIRYVEIGNVHYEKGRYDWAIREFKKATKADPSFDWAYFNMAKAFEKLNQFQDAIDSYQKVTTLGDKVSTALAHNNVGLIYEKLQDIDKAITHYKQAIQSDNTLSYAYSNLGDVYFTKEDYKTALEYFSNALKYDAQSIYALNNYANTLVKLNQYDEAIKSYNQAIEIDPESSFTYNNIGNAYVLKGMPDFALAFLVKAIKYDSENVFAWDTLGDVYFQLSNYDKSLESYHKVLDIKPDFSLVLYKIGKTLFASNHTNEAIDYLMQFIEKDQNHPKLVEKAKLLINESMEEDNHEST